MKNDISAVIFDMDGVISDTQKFHAKIESDLLSRYGISVSSEEITKKYAGVKTIEIFDELLKNQSIAYNLDDLMEEKWKQMTNLADQSVDEIDGSVELIKRLYQAGLKMAVASASNLEYVSRVIKTLNLNEYFGFLASGDMVKKGKPNPDIFLLAASKIGIEPTKCLVIEDGISGMIAAKSGGMKCIGLIESKEREYPTNNLVTSLKEITLDYISNLS
ncbi:MAG TPA: HAD family phosphatase [Candidatus Paceibacterota bacterium]|nr:HAD family phosphatase [Candidatus Paceibacterota bacterium]